MKILIALGNYELEIPQVNVYVRVCNCKVPCPSLTTLRVCQSAGQEIPDLYATRSFTRVIQAWPCRSWCSIILKFEYVVARHN